MRPRGRRVPLLLLSLALLLGCGADTADEGDDTIDDSTQALAASSWANDFQLHNLRVVNAYRAKKGLPRLALSRALSTFARAGSKELMTDHEPHAHFMKAARNGTLWSAGFKGSAGENQGDPHGWPRLARDARTNEMQQIDQIQKAMFDEGPGKGEAHGHYENMMNPKFRRIGVGLIEDPNGKLSLTNDFSE
jgi:hypothetical protein